MKKKNIKPCNPLIHHTISMDRFNVMMQQTRFIKTPICLKTFYS